jgi:PKHD-type hydroxylase
MIYKINLLNDKQLNTILKYYDISLFEDGKVSNTHASRDKKYNLIFNNKFHKINCEINEYLGQILNDNEYVSNVFGTKLISQIYLLWYKVGMHYDYHIDNNPIGGINAHMSMSCFLSDPDEYEGGELVLKIGNTETEYKLKAGEAIVYPTGLWHKINPVTKGERKVFVCWFETFINDFSIRNLMMDYNLNVLNMQKNYNQNSDIIDNGRKVIDDFTQFSLNFMRQYGGFC